MAKGSSGQQDAARNIRAFREWKASRSDDDFKRLIYRGQLSRKEIATQCGFANSVLLQNPTVRDELRGLEEALRTRSILPPLPSAPESRAAGAAMGATQAAQGRPDPLAQKDQRIRTLEERLISLQNENKDLLGKNEELKNKVKQLEGQMSFREDLLLTTGRCAR